MRSIEIILCCCCVFTGHFSNGSNIHTSDVKTRLINHTMELIDKGFTNTSNPVIITSDLVDDQIVSRNIDNGNPLIIMNGNFKCEKIKGYYPGYPTYVIKFESIENLMSLIFKFMYTTIWSSKSPIFILDISEKFYVAKPYAILGFLAQFDMLVSYYLRYDNVQDSTIVYTLNPYTQYAPFPWNEVTFANIKSKTKTTLYSLQYPEDVKENYQNINFDKTQYLDGHEIKILELLDLSNSTGQYNQTKISDYMITIAANKEIKLHSLPDYMNVTTSIYTLKNYFNIDRIRLGFDIDLHNRRYDAFNKMGQLADTNYKLMDFVKQYQEITFSILTKKTDYLTVIREITIDLNFIFITMFVLLLILLIIIINNKFHVSQGLMDIVSMSLGMGIMSPINRLSMKITYFFGFLFIFVVMPEFQGQISAVLSQPARRNVETLKDLFDNKYHVFYDAYLINDIINEKLWVSEEDQKYLHLSTRRDLKKCAIEAQHNSTIACIESTNCQFNYVLKLKNLYVSKESVFKKYYVFWTKKNWALKDKIDKARSIPVETGLINRFVEKKIKQDWRTIKKLEKIKEAEKYERVDFENLVFYFIMFAAISLWSLIIFGIELMVGHIHSKYMRQEKERRLFIERLRRQPRIILSPDRIVPSTSRE
ncbi:GSCOCG00005291001-RA-CDS [Cotesia congregata]|uniref:Uncharacterized protein n=1 Tax=Cotesia congregata TaxID=51543 RepID=A0A8J2MCY3_COTCN|nr:GSCOCG00005291001-RA-CDS [Cotesia congregata]CAG5084062.1 Protein of unknown function [Cotesia congregata]